MWFLEPPPPTNIYYWLIEPLQTHFSELHESWWPIVDDWYSSGVGREVENFLAKRGRASSMCLMPRRPLRSFDLTPLHDVRVVILGDHPSPIGNVSDGLAFSSRLTRQYCRATADICDELKRDLGIADNDLSGLDHWASRGVLLLNRVLTTEHKNGTAHVGVGWEQLTDTVIRILADDPVPKVFMLWGRASRTKASSIAESGNSHLVLESWGPGFAHRQGPDGFVGCGHFGKAKEFVERNGGILNWKRS